ncbi:hypothetical protein Tco_0718544 [Tanacetum coccineum]
MAAVNGVPQLVDKKGGMEPYYIKCIKDGPFQPKTAKGDAKHDIMESVISCETAKATWTDLVHSFEGPSDTKENRIIDLKLEYQTFRAKPNEISHRPTPWLTFSQGLRNANHTQTLDLTDIYGRFVYEDNLIQRRYSDNKKALITTPSSTSISIAFFSNNVIQDFQENSNDEVDNRQGIDGLADDELTVGKNHARNGKWIDITMRKCRDELLVLKQAKLDAITFQIQNTELTKLNHALQEQLKEEKKINEKWLTSSKSQAVNESLKSTKTSNLLESSKDFEADSIILPPLKNLHGALPSSEPETQDSLKNVSGPVTVCETEPTTPSVPTKVNDIEPESKINELTKLVQMLIDEKVNSTQKTQESNSLSHQTESSKSVNSFKTRQDSKTKVQNSGSSKSLRPKPIQKPQLKYELCLYTNHLTNDCYRILYCMKCKREDLRTSDHEIYTASLKRSENYKAQPYQYASPSKQILKAKAKPFPPCTDYGFNDHKPDDCRNYPECEIYGSYDQFTSGHNRVNLIRGGVLVESSQSSESSIGVKCNTCGCTVHSTTDHNEFDHFKRGEKN